MTIKGENITLTKKELSALLENALRLAGVVIIDTEDSSAGTEKPSKDIKIGQFGKDEYADVMHTMEVNRGIRPTRRPHRRKVW